MPVVEINYFIIENNRSQFNDVFDALARRGIDDKFISVDKFGLKIDLANTKLRCELEESYQVGNNFYIKNYKLFYEGHQLCSTTVHINPNYDPTNKSWERYDPIFHTTFAQGNRPSGIMSFKHSLGGLPDSLLQVPAPRPAV